MTGQPNDFRPDRQGPAGPGGPDSQNGPGGFPGPGRRGGGPGGPGDGGPFGPGGPRPNLWTDLPQDILHRIGQNEQDQPYFAVWGMFGELLRASAPDLNLPAPADISTTFIPGQPPPTPAPPEFRQRGISREVTRQGPMGIRVTVGKSLASEETDLVQLRWGLLAGGAAVLGIGLAGGWLLSQRAIKPIETITRTARSISASDLAQRIAVEDTQSELGSLAQTLNDTFARLETAFQQQVRFTADASHELRTPLSVIHSQAELALSRERTAPEYKQSLETCLRAAKRMKSLVESLLVLARADAGKLELKCQRVDLRQAADEVLAMMAARAQERKVTLESDLQPVQLEADPTRILQLLTNLIGNAIQYNREGGRVTVGVKPDGVDALITITDTGVGISAVDQKRVFERFFRADKARSREAGGSGLGLAICQSIVEAHGGTITFASQPDAGTSFTIRLPLSGAAARSAAHLANPTDRPGNPAAS